MPPCFGDLEHYLKMDLLDIPFLVFFNWVMFRTFINPND